MSQARFTIGQVNVSLLNQIEKEPATAYCVAMQFQLGCAIGELIAMGIDPNRLLTTIDDMVEKALATRAPSAETQTG